MNFQALPLDIFIGTVGKCNFDTIAKISQTNSKVNKVIKTNKLHQMDVHKISFTGGNDRFQEGQMTEFYVDITIGRQSKTLIRNNHFFEKGYVVAGPNWTTKQGHAVAEKMKQILSSTKLIKCMKFNFSTIDATLVQMLREINVDWRKVDVKFADCDYTIPKDELITFWKMFKSVDDCWGNLLEDEIEFFDDKFFMQTLPTVTYNLSSIDEGRFIKNLNITDRTLEFLAEHPPQFLKLGKFETNFTVKGIMQLFSTIASRREHRVERWLIGVIRLDVFDFNQAIEEFNSLKTDDIEVIVEPQWMNRAYKITIEYTRLYSNDKGSLSVALIKPTEIRAQERVALEMQLEEE